MASGLDGQRVLVTGGAVRIGRALALRFARAGARVVVHYRRSADAARQLIGELERFGPGHETVQCDLADATARAELIPRLLAAGETLHGLVNNASVYRRAALRDVDDQRLRLDYEINFTAAFLLMTDFARRCGKGFILNLLDQRVAAVEPAAGGYALAKKSLRDATEACAVEWAPDIRVNAVAPGIVLPPPGVPEEKLVPLLANVPMGCRSDPEEIAEAALYLATARTVTGQILFVDGGMHLARPVRPEVSQADYS